MIGRNDDSGGECEIRTHGRLRVGSFQDCWFKPLTQLSVVKPQRIRLSTLSTHRARFRTIYFPALFYPAFCNIRHQKVTPHFHAEYYNSDCQHISRPGPLTARPSFELLRARKRAFYHSPAWRKWPRHSPSPVRDSLRALAHFRRNISFTSEIGAAAGYGVRCGRTWNEAKGP